MTGREFQPPVDRINDLRGAEAQFESGIRGRPGQEAIFHHTTFLLGRTSSGNLRVPHRDATLHETAEEAKAQRQTAVADLPGTYVGELREGECYAPWGTGGSLEGSLVHGKNDRTHGSKRKK